MQLSHPTTWSPFCSSALEVYLLPLTRWEETLQLQQRLVFEMGETPRRRAALILCEHPPLITIGRQGSRQHIDADEDDLRAQGIRVSWTNRGGGCWLHRPGILFAYPVLPIDHAELRLSAYRDRLYETVISLLGEFKVEAERDPEGGISVLQREIAQIGIAVKDWVAYQGLYLNVSVPPSELEFIKTNPRLDRKMTSMFREMRTPVRMDQVRESFLRHFVAAFGFSDYYLCRAPSAPTGRRVANVVPRNS